MIRGVLACILFHLGLVLHAQPILESGQILPPGLSSFECSNLSFPVERMHSTHFYSQIQFQGHHALSEKWEMRLASATGWDQTVKHGSLLFGLTFQWMQNGAWSSALSGTVSKLYGDQIIPQHKFWLGATHSGRYEFHGNIGFCQNTDADPWHPLIACGWHIPTSYGKWLIEFYYQPDDNEQAQIGYAWESPWGETMIIVGGMPGSIPMVTAVLTI